MWLIVLKSPRSSCIPSCKPVFLMFLTFHFSHCTWTCQRDQINLVDIPPSLYLDLPNPVLVDICYPIMHGHFLEWLLCVTFRWLSWHKPGPTLQFPRGSNTITKCSSVLHSGIVYIYPNETIHTCKSIVSQIKIVSLLIKGVNWIKSQIAGFFLLIS